MSGQLVPAVLNGGTIRTGLAALPAGTYALLVSAAGVESTSDLKTINGNSLFGSGNITITSGGAWGSITGTLSAQADLQSALDAKQSTSGLGTAAFQNSSAFDAAGSAAAAQAAAIAASQPLDADLTSIAALSTTAYGRGLLALADAAALRSSASTWLQRSRVTFSNANYTAVATGNVYVAQIGTMSASRTVTLPAASSFASGDEIVIADESGTVTSTNTIVISRAGSDTINGATSVTIGAAYGWRRLISDGVSKWTFDGGILRASNNLSDVASVANTKTNLQITEPTAALVGSYDVIDFCPSAGKWIQLYLHPNQSTSATHGGGCGVSNTGTISTPAVAATNYRTTLSRIAVTGTSTAGQIGRIAGSLAFCHRGNAAGQGGWFYKHTFAVETAISGQRMFCGLSAGTAQTTGTEPSNFTNVVGMSFDAADTNWQIIHNDNAGACTKVDLGSSFPANTANTVFTLYLFAPQNGSAIYYEVRRRDSAAVASGTLSSNLPVNTTFLTYLLWGDNNATAASVILNHIRLDAWVKL